MADRDVSVRVEGLREFRRDLRRVSPDANKALTAELKTGANRIARKARSDPRTPRRTGEYANSIRAYTARGGVSVGSRLPQSGVLHWGGTIRPRGVPINFERNATVYDAAAREVDAIVDDVGDAIERAARQAGWRV